MNIYNSKNLENYGTIISENLKTLLSTYSINMLELSNAIKVSYTVIYKIIHSKANPTLDTLIKISDYFSISISELIGDIPIGDYYNKPATLKKIPVVPINNIEKFWNNEVKSNEVKNFIYTSVNITHTESILATISDKSMEPLFPYNSFLVLEQYNRELYSYDNLLVLITSSSSPKLKRLILEGKELFIQNINSSFPPQKLTNNDNIIAKVIQSISNF